MGLSFANPAGALGLLGLLAVLAIHLLQRRRRRVVVSTLFLLPPAPVLSLQGRVLERLRSSASLWLQLAAVLLLTWLLLLPRILRDDSVQRVVVVLDSSVSMAAFADARAGALARRLGALESAAAHTEWVLLETALRRPTLATGASLDPILGAAQAWQPELGTHDFSPGLAAARALAGASGRLLLVTDHVIDVPTGVELLAVGRPLDNVGFAGARVDGRNWSALVVNHSDSPQRRSWWVELAGVRGASQMLTLGAGETRRLEGQFAGTQDSLQLRLEPDAFTLDDMLPLVTPQPKPLRIAVAPAMQAQPFVERFVTSLDGVTRVGLAENPDLALVTGDGEARGAAIVFAVVPRPTDAALPGLLVSARHPWLEDLSWQGLLARVGAAAPALAPGEALVWQGARPLVLRRGTASAPHLVFDFPVASSNAPRLPAFVLLLHRFAESVRAAKVAPERRNVELGQALEVSAEATGVPVLLDGAERPLRAPARPGFFRISQGATTLVLGAAQFADVREADLRGCGAHAETTLGEAATLRRSQRELPWQPLWALAIAVLWIADWSRGTPRAGRA